MGIPKDAAWASKYVGLEFKDRGRTYEGGVDCWGLVRIVAKKEFGVELPSYDEQYATATRPEKVGEHVADVVPVEWHEIDEDDWIIGDVILMTLPSRETMRAEPCHVGVWLGNGWILHVHQGINTTCENVERPGFPGRVIGGYRYVGD